MARGALEAAIAGAKLKLPPAAEVSIVFSDDQRVRALNARYRGKDSATNVLSFPGAAVRGGIPPIVGDIVLAAETVRREAEEEGLTMEAHLTHLLVHGFLHLVGYDHEQEAEAIVMERLEGAILARLGIADPYQR